MSREPTADLPTRSGYIMKLHLAINKKSQQRKMGQCKGIIRESIKMLKLIREFKISYLKIFYYQNLICFAS